MESKKLYFDVDGSQIDMTKSILKKEFLELRMRAISTANPNRNNSWFTKESLLGSKDSFKNKPILGYFENGDFVSHNGEWKEDPETNMDYWDVTEVRRGERPIGLIRDSDEVEVIDDPETGLSWITLSCALWTQYNYKQVKRLLKDAKKAKQNGGAAKNISVEVDITDYEELPNGVLKINAFNLVGITILGSRNGVKVEPGIEGAELSVVDIMGTAQYEKQMQSLRLAYEKLDGSDTVKEEEDSEMEDGREDVVITGGDPETPTLQAGALGTTGPVINNEPVSEGDPQEVIHQQEEAQPEVKPEDHSEDQPEVQSGDENDSGNAGDPVAPEQQEEVVRQNNESQEQIQDVTWLLERISGFASNIECCLHYYEANAELIEGSDYILPVMKRVFGQTVANEKELAGLLPKIAEGLNPEDKEMANALSENYDCAKQYAENVELKAKCEEVEKLLEEANAKNETLEKQFEAIEQEKAHKKFMDEAKAVIAGAKLKDEIALSFETECEEGKISTVDELKTKIGLKLYEMAVAAAPTVQEEPKAEGPASFEAPITNPSTNDFVDDGKKAEKKDKWDTLKEFNRE